MNLKKFKEIINLNFTFFLRIKFIVSPKIAHFDFGDTPSNFGDSASVQCLVSSGDLPIDFVWFFNNKVIINNLNGISVAKMGKRNSVMNIDSVNGKNAGNYTCQVRNDASSANYTATLVVNGIYTIQCNFIFSTYKVLLCFIYYNFIFYVL